MRIVKIDANSANEGIALVKCSMVERARGFEDDYCVCLRSTGLDAKGDTVVHLITLTKNELALLNKE